MLVLRQTIALVDEELIRSRENVLAAYDCAQVVD
jgi:hypothetical protein